MKFKEQWVFQFPTKIDLNHVDPVVQLIEYRQQFINRRGLVAPWNTEVDK